MIYKISGCVKAVTPTQSIETKNGQMAKRTLVLDCSRTDPYNGRVYNDYPSFEAVGDGCSRLDTVQPGMWVEVEFVLSGRPYERNGQTLYFNTVRFIDIHPQAGHAAAPAPQPSAPTIPPGYPSAPSYSTAPPTTPNQPIDALPF